MSFTNEPFLCKAFVRVSCHIYYPLLTGTLAAGEGACLSNFDCIGFFFKVTLFIHIGLYCRAQLEWPWQSFGVHTALRYGTICMIHALSKTYCDNFFSCTTVSDDGHDLSVLSLARVWSSIPLVICQHPALKNLFWKRALIWSVSVYEYWVLKFWWALSFITILSILWSGIYLHWTPCVTVKFTLDAMCRLPIL